MLCQPAQQRTLLVSPVVGMSHRSFRWLLDQQATLDDALEHLIADISIVLEDPGRDTHKTNVQNDQHEESRRQNTDQLVTDPSNQPMLTVAIRCLRVR